MPITVTISASYGAYGDKVGHALAERLDLPFVDRAIPAAGAHELALSANVVESIDEHVPSRWQRLAMGFAGAEMALGPSPLFTEEIETPERFRSRHEAKIRKIADTTGAIILGRAGMVVLANRPDVLCVRLDGPVVARIAQVVAQGVDEESARRGQREIDKAREEFARVFFNARQDDPRLYHVMLDSTALSVEACVDIVVRAAKDRFGHDR
jgi:cytidylate kinase